MAKAKVVPTVSNEKFLETAGVLEGSIGGHRIMMLPRQFSTGSVGYHTSGKIALNIGGNVVQAQVQVNIIVIGSKPEIVKKVEKS